MHWPVREPSKSQSKNAKLKRISQTAFALRCRLDLYTLKFHLSDHPLEDLERFENVSFIDAMHLKHLKLLIKQSYTMSSRRLCRRKQGNVQNICDSVRILRRAGHELQIKGGGSVVVNKQNCPEKRTKQLVPDGSVFYCKRFRELLRVEENVCHKRSHGSKCWWSSLEHRLHVFFARCAREQNYMDRSCVPDGDIGKKLRAQFISRVLCLTLENYDLAVIKIKNSEI